MADQAASGSPLRRHRLLAPSAAVLVSPLCLGDMNLGDAWKSKLGECDKTTTFEILDAFCAMGGNSIDTGVNQARRAAVVGLKLVNRLSTSEESETWIGECMAHHPDRRDEMVIATKYAEDWKTHSRPHLIQSNYGGNSAKSLHISVAASLKKLRTTYIDLLYVHFWDYTATVEEVMTSLNVLVNQGKILCLGICNTPAWVVRLPGRWSAAERDVERDVIPMCKVEGMAIAPWGALGGGYFKPQQASPLSEDDLGRTLTSLTVGTEAQVSVVLEKIAKERDQPMTSIALAYVMHKSPYVFPIIGGRKISNLRSNAAALSIALSSDEIDEIDKAYDFNVGFPHNVVSGAKLPRGPDDNLLTQIRGSFDFVRNPEPIPPFKSM